MKSSSRDQCRNHFLGNLVLLGRQILNKAVLYEKGKLHVVLSEDIDVHFVADPQGLEEFRKMLLRNLNGLNLALTPLFKGRKDLLPHDLPFAFCQTEGHTEDRLGVSIQSPTQNGEKYDRG